MHNKEAVIAPLFEQHLNVICEVPNEMDTDRFGSFSGEIERRHDPITAARLKCEEAMRLSGLTLGIASEGSFGRHPNLPFSQGNEEIILLKDHENDLEIIGRHLTTETNMAGTFVSSLDEANQFANKVLFPSHGVIFKSNFRANSNVVKNIHSWSEFQDYVSVYLRKQKQVWIETDMRAMQNPTRMKAIAAATKDLIEKIKVCCPNCDRPGFGIVRVNDGLPCMVCDTPTKSTLSVVRKCVACNHEDVEKFPNKKENEDPTFCDRCNP